MAAIATATKNYFIGPQDGWFLVVTGAVTPIARLTITGIPCSHPFFVYAGASAPAANIVGVQVTDDDEGFVFSDSFNTTNSLFFVRIANPVSDSKNLDGRARFDVMATGGVLT